MKLKSSRALSVIRVMYFLFGVNSFRMVGQCSGKSLIRSAPARSCGGMKLDQEFASFNLLPFSHIRTCGQHILRFLVYLAWAAKYVPSFRCSMFAIQIGLPISHHHEALSHKTHTRLRDVTLNSIQNLPYALI
jgi:hypothetical protein